MLEFLPMPLQFAVQNINTNLLYEIRLRINQPIVINFAGKYLYLTTSGTSLNAAMAIIATLQDIEECIYRASDYSIYSVTEQIQQGFITAKCGERIGLAGAYVYEENKLQNIREITSLNIRVPHSVDGAADTIFKFCYLKEYLCGQASKKAKDVLQPQIEQLPNILLCSSAGCGKTTILRDLTKQIARCGIYNILLCDERNEITAMYADESLQLGCGVDVIRYAKKEDALKLGIRSMRPDMILTDELVSIQEVRALLQAYYAGVKVVATTHATTLNDIQNMQILQPALAEKVFDYYVFLKGNAIGEIATIYNGNLQSIYCAV